MNTELAEYAGRYEWMNKELLAKHLKVRCKENGLSDRKKGNGLKHRWFPLNLWNLWGCLSRGSGYPDRLWSLHHWKHSGTVWPLSWASRWPLLEQEGGCPEVSFNLKQSIILWICFTPKVNLEVEWCSSLFYRGLRNLHASGEMPWAKRLASHRLWWTYST